MLDVDSAVTVRRPGRLIVPWMLVAMLAIASAALLVAAVRHFQEQPAELSRVVFTVTRPSVRIVGNVAPELSPNGKHAPRVLFQTRIPVNPVIDQYAVAGNGQRFLLATPVGEEEPITVILNWTAGLKP